MASSVIERVKRININVFNYSVFVIFTSDLVRSMEKRGVRPNGPVGGVHIRAAENLPVSQIILPFAASTEVIVHECAHCAWAIQEIIGAKPDDEILAYCCSHLVGQVMRFQQKSKHK